MKSARLHRCDREKRCGRSRSIRCMHPIPEAGRDLFPTVSPSSINDRMSAVGVKQTLRAGGSNISHRSGLSFRCPSKLGIH